MLRVLQIYFKMYNHFEDREDSAWKSKNLYYSQI